MLSYTTFKFTIIFIILAFPFIVCTNSNNSESKSNKTIKMIEMQGFTFKLAEPDKVIKLDGRLQEISSLTFYRDSLLICIQDEIADIFILDIEKEQIIEQISSRETGDYEGVELVGNDLYLLKSSGTIREFKNFKQSNSSESKYKTALTPKNNTEGLAYDPRTNSLLIACKEHPYLPTSNQVELNVRCVYQFDLGTKTLKENPIISIKIDSLKSNFGIEQFMPSGIAVHPVTGDFYIISANGNWLLVLNRNNEIIHTQKLAPKLYKQPEGICFSPDGKTLFISNEGKDKKANILIFHSK